jgi:hypothetical protein
MQALVTGAMWFVGSHMLRWHLEVSLREGLAVQVARHVRRHERPAAPSGRRV